MSVFNYFVLASTLSLGSMSFASVGDINNYCGSPRISPGGINLEGVTIRQADATSNTNVSKLVSRNGFHAVMLYSPSHQFAIDVNKLYFDHADMFNTRVLGVCFEATTITESEWGTAQEVQVIPETLYAYPNNFEKNMGERYGEINTISTEPGTEYMIVGASGLNCRTRPDLTGEVVEVIPEGVSFTIGQQPIKNSKNEWWVSVDDSSNHYSCFIRAHTKYLALITQE